MTLAEAPDVLICSAMRRALDTAAPIARACRLVPRVEPALHERRVGALSGTPTHDREGNGQHKPRHQNKPDDDDKPHIDVKA